MGYMHIDSLHKCPEFFTTFPKVYVLEKIHGTSTWFQYDRATKTIKFHSGGSDSTEFKNIFDVESITDTLSKTEYTRVRVHGEGYGGKQQGMSETYGTDFKFIAFDVYVESENLSGYLNVDKADQFCAQLGLQFVHYHQVDNLPDIIEAEANKESVQAVRNGTGHNRPREGVVVKPIIESNMPGNPSKRAIFKHKNELFWEIKNRRPLGEKLKIVSDISQIVDDWVTENRFYHVIDRILVTKSDKKIVLTDIKQFIDLMVEDVQRESEGEVVWSPELTHAIRRKAGIMFKNVYCVKK